MLLHASVRMVIAPLARLVYRPVVEGKGNRTHGRGRPGRLGQDRYPEITEHPSRVAQAIRDTRSGSCVGFHAHRHMGRRAR